MGSTGDIRCRTTYRSRAWALCPLSSREEKNFHINQQYKGESSKGNRSRGLGATEMQRWLGFHEPER